MDAHWNHRVVLTRRRGRVNAQIAEVHYDAKGRPWGFTRADVFHSSEDDEPAYESLLQQVKWFAAAIDKPWLEYVSGKLRPVRKSALRALRKA